MTTHNCAQGLSNSPEDWLYGYDDKHGIPNLKLIDIVADTDNGNGHILGIVVSKPLASCRRCQSRLAQKIENYLEHIKAPITVAKWGEPSPEKTVIDVNLIEECHPDTIANLERMVPWAASHGVKLQFSQKVN